MSAPRVEIELDKLIHNAQKLTALYGSKGIRVTGVTKGVCGSPITTAGFNEIGRRIQALNIPALVVQEGGYCVVDLGRNVAAFLKGLTSSS